MISDKDLWMQRERYRDIRREIDREALARQAAAGLKRTPLLVRAIAFLQNWVEQARCRLVERYGQVARRPVSSPCHPQDVGPVPSPL